jgi:transcriptional regulator with PAS, ATPase and Fis domain
VSMDTEEKLELFEKIIEHYYGTVLVTDRNGVVIYVNSNVLKNTKDISYDELIGSTIQELVEQGYYCPSSILETLDSKKVVTKHTEGRIRHSLMTTSVPIFDDAGNLEYVVAYSQDLNYIDDMLELLKQEKEKTRRIIHLTNKINTENMVVAESGQMKQLLAFVEDIFYSDSTVLICGESGTGKEILAKYIYANSVRHNELFMPINCAALPSDLIESELFGYEKGAFTGAAKDGRPGLFEIADKGTLFLDEISELSLSIQAKLLRVLENHEIKHIGGNEIKLIDTRIIAATNRDLQQLVREKKFREDLFYRLNIIPVAIPPLRERKEDIYPLSEFFLNKLNLEFGKDKRFAEGTKEYLESYNWPGNVREVKNVIERRYVTTRSDIIDLHGLPLDLETGGNAAAQTPGADVPPSAASRNAFKQAQQKFEKDYIKQVLDKFNGNVSKSAEHLGISRSDLYLKIKKYNIDSLR